MRIACGSRPRKAWSSSSPSPGSARGSPPRSSTSRDPVSRSSSARRLLLTGLTSVDATPVSRPRTRLRRLGYALLALFVFLVMFAYDVLFEVRAGGRTLGKRSGPACGSSARAAGPSASSPAATRNILRLVDILPGFYGLGMAVMFLPRATSAWATSRPGRSSSATKGGRARRREGIRACARRGGPRRATAAAGTSRAGTSARSGAERSPPSAASSSAAATWPPVRADLAGDLARRLRPKVAGAPDAPRPRRSSRGCRPRRPSGPSPARCAGSPRRTSGRCPSGYAAESRSPRGRGRTASSTRGPLEVVQQGPDEVAAQVDAVGDRAPGRAEVAVEVRDPLGVGDGRRPGPPRRRRRRRSR